MNVFRDNLQLGVKWETAVQIGAQTLMPYGSNFLDNFKSGVVLWNPPIQSSSKKDKSFPQQLQKSYAYA
jgi:hypothetical protein